MRSPGSPVSRLFWAIVSWKINFNEQPKQGVKATNGYCANAGCRSSVDIFGSTNDPHFRPCDSTAIRRLKIVHLLAGTANWVKSTALPPIHIALYTNILFKYIVQQLSSLFVQKRERGRESLMFDENSSSLSNHRVERRAT